MRAQAELIALANETVIIRDAGDRILSWNAAAERMYGFTARDALGRVTHDLLSTRFPDSRTAVARALARDGFWEGQLAHVRADGTTIHVLSRQAVRRDADGRVLAIVELDWDITERVVAERTLREWSDTLEARVAERTAELEARTRALAAFTAFTEAAGVTTDLAGLASRAVSVLRDVLEAPVSGVYYALDEHDREWHARAWSEDLGAEIVADVPAALRLDHERLNAMISTTGPTFVNDYRSDDPAVERIVRAYGTLAFCPVTVSGKVTGILIVGERGDRRWSEREEAVVRAVTRSLTLALEHAEQGRRLARQNDELVARNAALRGFALLARDLAFTTDPLELVGQAQDLVLSLLPGGASTYWEARDGRMFLTQHRGELGSPELIEYLRGGVELAASPNLSRALGGERVFLDTYDAVVSGLDRRLVEHVGAAAMLPVIIDGRARAVFGVVLFGRHRWTGVERAVLETAVHSLGLALERVDFARALEDQRAKLEVANADLEAFAYSISHDLRAPVRHIGAFAGLLKRSVEHDERALKYLGTIEGAAGRMNTLIDELLHFARLGLSEPGRAPVDLAALVEATREELAPALEGRQVRWRVGALPNVPGDETLLRQVVANLLGNAVKYSRTRDVAVVEVWADVTDAEVRVFVRDNGVGFDPRYASRLFGVFQRLHRAEEFEGNGVGLANVKRIVQRHGGRVWAESSPGEGATFSFSLPR